MTNTVGLVDNYKMRDIQLGIRNPDLFTPEFPNFMSRFSLQASNAFDNADLDVSYHHHTD
ncbi:hypothetical protein NEUTE1DRAFT_135722 [Neurospora tetrasperma FGSC 2508]|uniref:Uncharacterized protein n=1 Tax=Neurospora tetrasperma (strain FGSC 2508 / ATCC MYA-4615 / P0657) TaxID=510951 RepID=F8MGJ8_NEUT8|nr:uncharacterized protein NEUTE1DRAFT_135722 [Neurospora tetrasperma FGSC 2508]EGO58620.1 hypothetical protein NEUTE1DRAFT_135722 [Neurospora tetrasperma FGSC 2508]